MQTHRPTREKETKIKRKRERETQTPYERDTQRGEKDREKSRNHCCDNRSFPPIEALHPSIDRTSHTLIHISHTLALFHTLLHTLTHAHRRSFTHTHAHTRKVIYLCPSISLCVCACVCICVYVFPSVSPLSKTGSAEEK
eukprot:Gregarina_sp_Pseudo_9__5830@NODE_894_length_2082_cov_290_939794_g839_i0_p2_GENE_NODE_894_length_2082_cov_290_939794_g839_i0NODE_894_length_2082_cov_290_939794_g839_i0_p2_ORF_typecomplete_len140_score12_20_NODE_894_length_2082_cov_290_939794_g839_i012721691